mmetsp:Transcript_110485/g.319288  ORF Transcript_110485/g.319288 Transcript_110485/m.319288 type:complete len:322 (-) Transcript_110485:342-1307(-)
MGVGGATSSRRPAMLGGGICALVVGAVLLAVGIWATTMYVRFTPVYSDIECRLWAPQLQPGFSLATGQVDLIQKTVCHNPNPYSVNFESSRPGGIYVGDDRRRVGTIKEIPASKLAEGKDANITAKIAIDMLQAAGGAAACILGCTVPVFFENNLDVDIDADTVFGSFRAKRAYSKDCGLNVRIQTIPQIRIELGSMTCEDDWEQLVLSEVDEGTRNSSPVIVASAESMGEDEDMEQAERLKNTSLGSAMGVGYGLGAVFIIVGAVALFRWRRSRDEGASAAPGAAIADEGKANTTKEMTPKIVAPAAGDQRETPIQAESV